MKSREQAVIDKLGGEARADAFLRGELEVVEAGPIVFVDRSVAPSYDGYEVTDTDEPFFSVQKLGYADLERSGPSFFDVSKLDLWIHERQMSNYAPGEFLLNYLHDQGWIESCLGMSDLQAIQKRGADFFRKYFGDKKIFAWKSIARDHGHRYGVPCLSVQGGGVVINWVWLSNIWHGSDQTIRFAE